MNHPRIVRTVCFITVSYLIVLSAWLGWLVEHTPEGTIPYQIGGLLAAYGSTLGLGMMWADRPTGPSANWPGTGSRDGRPSAARNRCAGRSTTASSPNSIWR